MKEWGTQGVGLHVHFHRQSRRNQTSERLPSCPQTNERIIHSMCDDEDTDWQSDTNMGTSDHLVLFGFSSEKKFKWSILQAMGTIWELFFTCHPRPTVIQKMIPLPPHPTKQWQEAHTQMLLIAGWEGGNSTEIGTEESDLEQLFKNQLCLMCPEKANIPGTSFCSPKHCLACVFHFQRRYSGLGW